MPGSPTPNLGLVVPTVGGDVDAWGAELNGDLTILDALGIFSFSSPFASGPITFGIQPQTTLFATGGALGISLTLPAPATAAGRIVTIKKVDSGIGPVNVITPVGVIDGLPNYTLFNQYQYVTLLSDGLNWNVIGNN